MEKDPVDIETLKTLAVTADGLITKDLRCRAWPKLLNVNVYEMTKPPKHKKGNFLISAVVNYKTCTAALL